ncbi:hypothetical protein CASFOL_039969 [Castilleja foliolosa]|uniref:VLRF1 domain-containing protein n=1 Tax=Castilleja foliolosa TaxID=1961234 RepID=A0ABD3BHA2_9LAMI
MATDGSATAIAEDKPSKTQPRKQHKQDQTSRHRSIFEVPSDFFDSCHILESPFSSFPESDIHALEESKSENEFTVNNNSNPNDVKAMQRWSCNTCKAEFDSLQDQRFHFKSDLHRFNIKLSIAGKSIIKEDDFDGAVSDSLCKDYDVSSISGSEDEDEKENNRQHEFVGISKRKIFMELQNGERVSLWRCLLLDESENILFETDRPLITNEAGVIYLSQREVIEKLKYIVREPRDSTCLRIVLLARGGHFAGCVFDGSSLVAHKTFHRYVIRAKAGKKQSSKDAGGGRTIHSAGASLRRYNELGLKKDIQELLTLWKPHFAVASCVFIYAPSNNRQLLYDGDKPYFTCQHRAIKSIPLTIRRPTLKEAKRVYFLLVQISPEIRDEVSLNTKYKPLIISNEIESREILEGSRLAEACPLVNEMNDLDLSAEPGKENDIIGTWTPLHEAAKSGNADKVLELLELGLDPCVKDERGQTPYMVASEKEVRNNFRRFMALNLERWDWHAAKVPSALTKEMEELQAVKQAEKDAKRKARAKELKKLRKAKEKKAQEEAAQSQNETGKVESASASSRKGHVSTITSKEDEQRRIQDEREKRAAAAERRIAALKTQEAAPANTNASGSGILLCSCCHESLAGKVPFHRYSYKYCSTSCMHLHKEILEDE